MQALPPKFNYTGYTLQLSASHAGEVHCVLTPMCAHPVSVYQQNAGKPLPNTEAAKYLTHTNEIRVTPLNGSMLSSI